MSKKGLDYSMNKYVKNYLLRGLIFSGLGPVVMSIVYLCLESSGVVMQLSAVDQFKAIISTYIIAFVHAGGSVFPTIEEWPKVKAAFFQGLTIWAVYLIGYLVNDWIPLSWLAIGLYTGCFILAFVGTWIIVILVTKAVVKKMNEKIKEINK